MKFVFYIFSMLLITDSTLAAQVFYLEKTEDGITWSILNTEKKSVQKFNKTYLHPKEIIWSTKSNKAFYHNKKGIYEYNWVSKKTNKLYTYTKEDNPIRLSLNKNGKILFVSTQEIPESSVIIKKKGDEQEVHFIFEEKKHLFNDYYDGVPYMAEVFELHGKGKRRISATPITLESGASTGLRNIEPQIKNTETSVSLRHLKYSATLAGKNKTNPFSLKKNIFYDLDIKKQATINKVFSLDKPAEGNDGPTYYKIGKNKGLAAWSVFGDSSHFSSPIFLCSNFCEQKTEISKKEKTQLSLSLNGNLLLMTDEYTNADASLIDTHSNKTIYKFNSESKSVVFLPKEISL